MFFLAASLHIQAHAVLSKTSHLYEAILAKNV